MSLELKTKNMKYFLIIALYCCSLLSIHAQVGELFDTDNELSSNMANQVFQDHKGFIWIATRNGLNLYDGYNFTVIRSYEKRDRGFTNNYINCINEDQEGNLILGTNNAVVLYDGHQYTRLPMDYNGIKAETYINNILVRKNGEIWACTSGYGIMQITDHKKCTPVKALPSQYKFIFNALEDQQGRIWILREDFHLMRLEKNGKLTTYIPGTDGLRIKAIAQDKLGNIYLASENQGVYVMYKNNRQFSRINTIPVLPINRMYIGQSGLIYLGCDGKGLYVYNPKNNTLTNNPFFSNRINLAQTKVSSIIEDRQGNVWFSMLQKGVFMQPHRIYDFKYMGYRLGSKNVIGEYCVTSVLYDKNGDMWVGTDKDGIYRLTANSGYTHAIHLATPPFSVLALCQDNKGNVWLGTYRNGCGYIDTSGTFHNVALFPNSDFSVFNIKKDATGNLWFATMGNGLACLRTDGTTKIYINKDNAENNPKANSIPNSYLAKIAFSNDGKLLFVASSIGLHCLNIQTGSWISTFGVNCLNKGNFSHSVFVDKQDRVWYGSENGLFCYDLKDIKHPKRYTTTNGLPDNTIALITQDANGKIWVGTNHGLCQLDTQTGKTTNYFVENGLQSNEFSDGTVCNINNGKLILLGGTGGINWFNPLNVKQHKWNAHVILSKFIIGNETMYPDEENEFTFAHEDNSFTIQLSTLTYNNKEQIAYAYSINGEDWHTMQTGNNELSFSHMPPGTYKFRVKALSNSQETPIKTFTVTIRPAWYASTWAKIFYFLCLLGIIYIYIQHTKKKEEDRLLLQKHIHAEEMGEAKLKFFMNISHEIRTPLTLIITPLLSLIKEDKDPQRQGYYDIIRKNSERILHLINQMMDLRKIDKGQMVMHMSKTNMVAFINDEYELFAQQATSKHISFNFIHEDEELPAWIDRNNFDKVLMNVLSNAFKFTPVGGKIDITLSHSPHHIRISIKDSGVGIPKDKLETIFQRFYQNASTSTDRNIGTGIGLDLTRSLVELHYGTIAARNNEGEPGSEFIISLPKGKDHLKPEEIIEDLPETKQKKDLIDLEEDQAEEEALPADTTMPKEHRGKSIIALVEDDEAILEYLSNQLSNDFRIITFHNGKEALPEIIRQTPDLVISDIMMPEMDGNTLCTKLKANVNTNHIPIILLTAMSREEDQLAGLQTGADAYIVKPFNMDILRRTILNLLSVRKTLRNKFTGMESQEDKVQQVEVETPDDALMARVMQVINENMNDSELSVDMIASKVGISRVHLYRKMKELTNQTPHNFIRNIRLQQAAKLLHDPRQTVTDVMFACGFINAASFSTMFKNTFGASPRDYKQQQQGKAPKE